MSAVQRKKRILVISDTHWNVHRVEEVFQKESPIDLVLHLGDLEGEDAYIRKVTGCPLEAVRGNCDHSSTYPVETMITLGNYTVFMTHGHRYEVQYGTYELEDMARGCGADIAMYGHTHCPYFKKSEDGFITLNPGSLGNPRQNPRIPSYMMIELEEETGELEFHQKYLE